MTWRDRILSLAGCRLWHPWGKWDDLTVNKQGAAFQVRSCTQCNKQQIRQLNDVW